MRMVGLKWETSAYADYVNLLGDNILVDTIKRNTEILMDGWSTGN
jgi:hypothetical protein